MDRRSAVTGRRWMSWPSRRMVPSVGSTIRLIMRRVVVLPQPEGPTRTVIERSGISSDSRSTATVPSGYRFVTESIRIKTPNALRGGGTVARGHALGRRTSLDTATDSTPERAGPGSGHARHAATCPAAPAGNPLIPVRSPPPARGRSCRIAVDVREESAGACGTGRRVPQYERVDNVRLLVVDDDPPIADLVATGARYEGWQAVTANSGAQALRRAARFRPDIVVLDLMLPDVAGFGVLDRLRRAGTMVPVVFLTARDGVADRVEGLTRG